MGKSKNALVLFARDPVKGQVKTRLQTLLTPETILQLYTCFLRDSIAKIASVEEADSFIGIYPSDLSGFFSRLKTDRPIQVFIQEGKDLGERMRNAFAPRFKEGYEKVMMIGADSPSLPRSYIENAFRTEKNLVIGPSMDGGYYLIGMVGKLVNVFEGVAWGSDNVLVKTLEQIQPADVSLELLPPWYDVDRPEDLRFLKTHLAMMSQAKSPEAAATSQFINTLEL